MEIYQNNVDYGKIGLCPKCKGNHPNTICNYDKSTENNPNEWSYVKKGLSSDMDRLLGRRHTEFVFGENKELPKPIEEHFESDGNGYNKYEMNRFLLYFLGSFLIGFLCSLMNSSEKGMSVMNFIKSPGCIGLSVTIMIVYFMKI